MKTKKDSRLRLSTVAGVVTMVLLAAVSTSARKYQQEPLGFPDDWSHRSVIFSAPETFSQLVSSGRATQEQWDQFYATQNDPRYLIQLRKREREQAAQAQNAGLSGSTAANWIADRAADERNYLQASGGNQRLAAKKPKKGPPPTEEGEEVHRDWSQVMGGAAGAGTIRTFPAKYSFSISSKDCANDFIVFTTSATAANSSGGFYTQAGTFSAAPTAGQTFVITNTLPTPDLTLTLTADASVNTGVKFAVGGTAAAAGNNLADAISRNGGSVGVTATSNGSGGVTVTSITTGIQLADISYTNGLSNFTLGAEAAGTVGTKGQPTIFALNQMYADTLEDSGCSRAASVGVPSTYWSYNTTGTIGSPTAAVADLSPVLSYHDNGAQVAFVQRSGTAAYLVLLKWSAGSGTIGVPTAPTDVAAASYKTCTAPCMTRISLGTNNTGSSPFVDYAGNALYVGDDLGRVHKIENVFSGSSTPAEASGWPITVTGVTSVLSSPVFDGTYVWVGSVNDEKLHRIDSLGNVLSSAAIAGVNAGTNLLGVSEPPIVDIPRNIVYAFVSANSACTARAVYQFDIATFSNGSSGTAKTIGQNACNDNGNRRSFAGTFDTAYFNTGTGYLYACGSGPAAVRRPTLWRIPVSASGLGTPEEGPVLVSADTVCSPVTGLMGVDGVDRIFMSVQASGSGTGCTGACVYALNLPSAAAFNTTSTSASITGTQYISVSTSAAPNAAVGPVETTLSAAQAGTYYGITITQGAANAAGVTRAYTLFKDGIATSITCTVAAAASTCTDTANSASFVNGSKIAVRVVTTGAAATMTLRPSLGWTTSLAMTAGLAAPGGTSGIVIDNSMGSGGSQVYYSTITSPGLAVQASQKALK